MNVIFFQLLLSCQFTRIWYNKNINFWRLGHISVLEDMNPLHIVLCVCSTEEHFLKTFLKKCTSDKNIFVNLIVYKGCLNTILHLIVIYSEIHVSDSGVNASCVPQTRFFSTYQKQNISSTIFLKIWTNCFRIAVKSWQKVDGLFKH